MEIREAEKTVIAKPVASRPDFSGFQSFSQLLAGAINPSPRNTFSTADVAAIKPRTVRFKPVDNPSLDEMDSLEAERSGSEDSYPSDDVVKSEKSPSVIYKPIAKLASKTTISILANLGRDNLSSDQQEISKEVGHAQPHNKANNDLEESSRADKNYIADVDRPSYDGYNWKKYGQKQVKGSEYPRSYYKCTNHSCPVKKKVERMLDGRIAEVVYKGVHNHPKPRLSKHALLDGQGLGLSKHATCNEVKIPIPNEHHERNEQFGGGLDHRSQVPSCNDVVTHGEVEVRVSTPGDSFGLSDEVEEIGKGLEDEPKSKRRKKRNQSTKEGAHDPQTLNQNFADCEVLGDGYRWRKYGQKVVKGNSYPRSYYRCTSFNCNVRKYVERTSDDPNAFVTTYEGRHNHEMPIKNADSTSKASARNKQLT